METNANHRIENCHPAPMRHACHALEELLAEPELGTTYELACRHAYLRELGH